MGDRALDLAGLGVSRAGELLRTTSAKEAWVAMGGEKSDSESEEMESSDQRMTFGHPRAPLGKKGSTSGERWETGVDGAGLADGGGGRSASP